MGTENYSGDEDEGGDEYTGSTPTAELTVRQLLYFSPEDEEGRLDAINLVDQILIQLSVFIISH